MTREELLKIFQQEGGLSKRTQQRFAFRECAYIKIAVTFQAVGEANDKAPRSAKDKIITISQPFLELPIAD